MYCRFDTFQPFSCDVLSSIINKFNRTTCGLDPFPTDLLMSHLWIQTTQPTSGYKGLCKSCRNLRDQFTVFVQAGHADPLDGRRCSS